MNQMRREMSCLSFILHAHLPFVRHPEHAFFWEEHWLFEAITGCYLPLLNTLNRLKTQGVPFRIAMSLTPPLIYMLQDALLRTRYQAYLARTLELVEKERLRTRFVPHMNALAEHYRTTLYQCQYDYTLTYGSDLVSAFGALQQSGHLEILASCATHGFLPYLLQNPTSVRAQINLGVDLYRRTFGCAPRGFWLPECGYTPGLENTLADAGVHYFVLDTHGVTHAEPNPRFGPYQGVRCANGVAVFARDPESSHQVWSAESGYPSAPTYREFHRDLGYDAEFEYIRPYIDPTGSRVPTGIKYWRITGATEQKALYVVASARVTAIEHAANFVTLKKRQFEQLRAQGNTTPVIIAPFDAELFGHWWYEGPLWLEYVLRGLAADPSEIISDTPSGYLTRADPLATVAPAASTWGYAGYGEYWLNPSNDWVYPRLHLAGTRITELTHATITSMTTLRRNACNQAARELLLAEASDWTFMLRTGNVAPYASQRLHDHLKNFDLLYHGILSGRVDQTWLTELHAQNNIFHDFECLEYYRKSK